MLCNRLMQLPHINNSGLTCAAMSRAILVAKSFSSHTGSKRANGAERQDNCSSSASASPPRGNMSVDKSSNNDRPCRGFLESASLWRNSNGPSYSPTLMNGRAAELPTRYDTDSQQFQVKIDSLFGVTVFTPKLQVSIYFVRVHPDWKSVPIMKQNPASAKSSEDLCPFSTVPAHISCRKRKTDGAIEKIIITNKDGIFIKPLVLPEHCYGHNQAGGRKGGSAGHWAIHVELVGDGLRELIGRIPFEVCGNMSSKRKRTKNEPTEKIRANVSFGPRSSPGTSTISPTAGASADHHDSLPLNIQ